MTGRMISRIGFLGSAVLIIIATIAILFTIHVSGFVYAYVRGRGKQNNNLEMIPL